jgi:hypothetical protein
MFLAKSLDLSTTFFVSCEIDLMPINSNTSSGASESFMKRSFYAKYISNSKFQEPNNKTKITNPKTQVS